MNRILRSINPATLEPLGEIRCTESDAVAAAVAAARAAAPAWAATPLPERAAALLRAREYLLVHRDALAKIISQENGKPLLEAFTAELYPIADLLHYYATHATALLRAHRIPVGTMAWLGRASWIEYQPIGVVGVISPWNYPFSIPAGTVAMALLAGNCVLLKPSEVTPLVGQAIADLFDHIGLPTGVFTHLPGDGQTGQALTNSPLDKLLFTGSVATGQQIMRTCANTLTRVNLELGGKDPMIVCADADLDRASSGAVWGAFTNAGQVCASVERVYVHHSVSEQFTAQVVAKTKQLRLGIGLDPDVDVGPLTREPQLRLVEEHVADAVRRGAQVACGGARDIRWPGYFYQPTVLTATDHTMRVMREETFGPVLAITAVTDDAQAIQLANDSPFGLTASVWSRSVRHATTLGRHIETGTVMINDCVYTHAICQTPWGGRKQSGFGRTHGTIGLMELVEPVHFHVTRWSGRKNLWWYPYDPSLYALFRRMTADLTSGLGSMLRAAPQLVRGLLRKKL